MYENATILSKAVEVIEKLNEIYDIHICSSCINSFDEKNSGSVFKDKYNLLYSLLPYRNVSDDELLEKGVVRTGVDWRLGWDEIKKILL